MKRSVAIFLVLIILFTIAGCNKTLTEKQSNAFLQFCGVQEGDTTQLTQALTEEEAQKVKEYLAAAELIGYEPKCLFSENISITLDGKVYAIAYDNCASFWILGSDDYYTISEEGKTYIESLFTKYVSYFPFP